MMTLVLGLVACTPTPTGGAPPDEDDDTGEVEEAYTGNPLANCVEHRVSGFSDGDDWQQELTYDGEGRWTESRYDDEADGEYEWVYRAAYDELGQMIRYDWDGSDPNESPDGWDEYVWEGGVHVQTDEYNSLGRATARWTYEYDDSGREVRMDWDAEPDGTSDGARLTVWTAVDGGWLQVETSDWYFDEVVDQRAERTWDDAGLLLTEWEDSDGDGFIEYEVAYAYEEGVLVEATGAVYETGLLDYHWDSGLEYDRYGRLYTRGYDYDADGWYDRETSHRYDCIWDR